MTGVANDLKKFLMKPIFIQALFALILILPMLTQTLVSQALNVRNIQIAVYVPLLIFVLRSKKSFEEFSRWDTIDSRRMLGVCLVAVMVASLSQYWAFELNGIDFSVFDDMLYNTRLGKFMYSRQCECFHFGIHPSFIMIPMAWLHSWIQTPYFAVMVHAVLIWSAGAIFFRLAQQTRHIHGFVLLLFIVGFFTNKFVGSALNYGFHVEVFYFPIGAALLYFWEVQKWPWVWFFAVLWLSIKEDAGLYLAMFALTGAALNLKSSRAIRNHGVGLFLLSTIVFILEIKLIQPYFNQSNAGNPQTYLNFWSHYGPNIREAAMAMLRHPGRVVADILKSHWWEFFGASLFIPVLYLPSLAAMIPGMMILGTSGHSAMTSYGLYYSSPMLPFYFYGLMKASDRLLDSRKVLNKKFVYAALILFPLVGVGSLRYEKPHIAAMQAVRSLKNNSRVASAKICAQAILFPHLPYAWNLNPLNEKCLTDKSTKIIMASDLDPYPFERSDLLKMAASEPTRVIDISR